MNIKHKIVLLSLLVVCVGLTPPLPKVNHKSSLVERGAGAKSLLSKLVIQHTNAPITNVVVSWTWIGDTNNYASNVVFNVRSKTNNFSWKLETSTTNMAYTNKIDKTLMSKFFEISASNKVTHLESKYL